MKRAEPPMSMNERSDPALELLRRAAPPTLSTLQLRRTRARVLAEASERARAPGRGFAMLGMAASLALAVGLIVALGGKARDGAVVRAAPGEAVALLGSSDARAALVGPGVARVEPGGAILLSTGTLLVHAAAQPLRVQAPNAEVTIAAHGVAEVRVESWRVIVAAYQGHAEARFGTRLVDVRTGLAFASSGAAANDPAREACVHRWAEGDSHDLSCAFLPTSSAASAPALAPVVRESPGPSVTRTAGTRPAKTSPPRNKKLPSVRGPSAVASVEAARPRSLRPSEPPKQASSATAPGMTAPAADDPLVRESELLASAIQRLHRANDPRESLALLDQYALEFPKGALRAEATVVRIDALLAAHRTEDARALLERLDLDALESSPRGPELRVFRGELRAGTGDAGGARRDLRRYLAHFPSGQLAARARAALQALP